MSSPRRFALPRPLLAPLVFLAVAAVVAVLCAQMIPSQRTSNVDAVIPAPRTLPAQIDAKQQYEGQTVCDPVEKTGVTALRNLLNQTYGTYPIGTVRSCNEGRSEHADGRALDWMVSIRNPAEAAKAQAFLAWLLGPDATGRPAGNARRMGIMYMGWNNQFWRGYGKVGWSELRGCLAKSKAGTGYDTDCHRNHIHFSLTWDGAAGATSYWSGTAMTRPSCPRSGVSGKVVRYTGVANTVAIAPKGLIYTLSGKGVGRKSCRISAGSTQSVRVAGAAGVPSTNIAYAILEVTVINPNAPTTLVLGAAGKPNYRKATIRATQNQTTSATVQVPLGKGGAVSMWNTTGSTDARVRIVGYGQGS